MLSKKDDDFNLPALKQKNTIPSKKELNLYTEPKQSKLLDQRYKQLYGLKINKPRVII
jgi:hypothetical protein